MTTRRTFVRGLAGAALAVGFAPGLVLGNPLASGRAFGEAALNLDRFEPYLNTTFTLQSEAGASMRVKLVEAYHVYPQERTLDQFILIFKQPDGTVLPDGCYQVTHEALGQVDLFLVCEGHDASGVSYQSPVGRYR